MQTRPSALPSTPDTYTLTINTTGSGSVAKSPDQSTYIYGDVVTLTATPAAGYAFAGWSGGLSGTANPATITMTGNKTVTAAFTQIQYTLSANNDGHGTVTLNPTAEPITRTQQSHFRPAQFRISVFSAWSGANAGDVVETGGVYTIQMNGNKSVTANFSLIPVITVTSPNGGQNWLAGSSHVITWTSVNASGTVHIEYSTNNGTAWTDIETSTTNNGSYAWTIPNAPSVNCLVRVSDTDGNPTDMSNAVFAIVNTLDQHFIPVWLNNGFDHMNFYTVTAKIDDIDLQPGDEIGIFDGTACVGVGIISQVLDGDDIFLRIKASRDDEETPEVDGFTEGHTASFRIWDASEEKEFSSVEITYETDQFGELYDNIFDSQRYLLVSYQRSFSR